jgi:hypothetical protein
VAAVAREYTFASMRHTQRMHARSLLVLVVLAVPRLASAGKFGGFSADGTHYLDGKDQVCTAAVVDAGGQVTAPGGCAASDKKSIAQLKLVSPSRSKVAKTDAGGWVQLAIVVDGQSVRVEGRAGADPRPLATRDLAQPIKATRGPWLASDGKTVAFEVDVGEGKSKDTLTLAFDVGAGLDVLRPKAGSLVDRVTKKASTWVQAQVPCEQAGVTLELGPGSAFSVTTDVRCQSDRDKLRVGGDFWGEEPDKLIFRFQNEDGPDERFTCQLQTCDGDDCIACASGDVTFTVRPTPTEKAKPKPGPLTRPKAP